MHNFKTHFTIKLISITVIFTFLTLDISRAYPFQPASPPRTLAAETAFQLRAHDFHDSILYNAPVLNSVFHIAKYLLEDTKDLDSMESVVGHELISPNIKLQDVISLSHVKYHPRNKNAVLIPYETEDAGTHWICVALLKDFSPESDIADCNWSTFGKYVFAVLPEDYDPSRVATEKPVEKPKEKRASISISEKPIAEIDIEKSGDVSVPQAPSRMKRVIIKAVTYTFSICIIIAATCFNLWAYDGKAKQQSVRQGLRILFKNNPFLFWICMGALSFLMFVFVMWVVMNPQPQKFRRPGEVQHALTLKSVLRMNIPLVVAICASYLVLLQWTILWGFRYGAVFRIWGMLIIFMLVCNLIENNFSVALGIYFNLRGYYRDYPDCENYKDTNGRPTLRQLMQIEIARYDGYRHPGFKDFGLLTKKYATHYAGIKFHPLALYKMLIFFLRMAYVEDSIGHKNMYADAVSDNMEKVLAVLVCNRTETNPGLAELAFYTLSQVKDFKKLIEILRYSTKTHLSKLDTSIYYPLRMSQDVSAYWSIFEPFTSRSGYDGLMLSWEKRKFYDRLSKVRAMAVEKLGELQDPRAIQALTWMQEEESDLGTKMKIKPALERIKNVSSLSESEIREKIVTWLKTFRPKSDISAGSAMSFPAPNSKSIDMLTKFVQQNGFDMVVYTIIENCIRFIPAAEDKDKIEVSFDLDRMHDMIGMEIKKGFELAEELKKIEELGRSKDPRNIVVLKRLSEEYGTVSASDKVMQTAIYGALQCIKDVTILTDHEIRVKIIEWVKKIYHTTNEVAGLELIAPRPQDKGVSMLLAFARKDGFDIPMSKIIHESVVFAPCVDDKNKLVISFDLEQMEKMIKTEITTRSELTKMDTGIYAWKREPEGPRTKSEIPQYVEYLAKKHVKEMHNIVEGMTKKSTVDTKLHKRRVIDLKPAETDSSTSHKKDKTDKTDEADKLFNFVQSEVNNTRTKLTDAANGLVEFITAHAEKRDDLSPVDIPKIDRNAPTAEIITSLEQAASSVDRYCEVTVGESDEQDKINKQLKTAAEIIRKGLYKIKAGGMIESIIILARSAAREGENIVIGIETDWIPGNEEGSLQHTAMNPLMIELRSLPEILKERGIKNAKIFFKERNETIPDWTNKLKSELTSAEGDFSKLIVQGGQKTIEYIEKYQLVETAKISFKETKDIPAWLNRLENELMSSEGDSLKLEAQEDKKEIIGYFGKHELKGVEPQKRALLAEVDPVELIEFYEKHKEDNENQLAIQFQKMLSLTLDLATGKNAPKLPDIEVKYDKTLRKAFYLPHAIKVDYRKNVTQNKLSQTALKSL